MTPTRASIGGARFFAVIVYKRRYSAGTCGSRRAGHRRATARIIRTDAAAERPPPATAFTVEYRPMFWSLPAAKSHPAEPAAVERFPLRAATKRQHPIGNAFAGDDLPCALPIRGIFPSFYPGQKVFQPPHGSAEISRNVSLYGWHFAAR